MSRPFVYVFLGIYALAVVFETISQLTYRRKSIPEIRAGFRWIPLKTFLLTVVLMVATLVWNYIGWREGQPIHLPSMSHWPSTCFPASC
jgi:hypothetical protein